MNIAFSSAGHDSSLMIPAEFEALVPPPLLLPGEVLQEYQLVRQAILSEISPRSAIDWLLAIDVVELSWDVLRYRRLRYKVLENYRQRAIEQALIQIETVGIAPQFTNDAIFQINLNALSWRTDPLASREIEARLATHGFDHHSVSAEVFDQAREMYLTFESLLITAQNRRLALLQEIQNFRHKQTDKRRRFSSD